jgi:hypothetical protein
VNTKNSFTKEQEKIVLKEYVENGRGQAAVMTAAKITLPQLKLILEKNGYKLRNRHEAIVAANKGRNLLEKQNYFSEENHNMAWLVGFLAADGSIEKDRNIIKLSLSTVDREILEKIRQEIGLKSEVKDYITQAGYQVSKIQWSSEQHKKDLAKYGVIPQKTFKLKPPLSLDRKYWIDYIRGFFDGDGSITLLSNNYNTLSWQITSATKEILEWIVDFFYEEYDIPKVNVHSFQRNTSTLYILQYSTNASKEIFKHLYTDNSLFLARKKEKYQKIIDIKNFN